MTFSKKLMTALIGMGLVTIGFVVCALLPAAGSQYPVFVGAIGGLVGLFAASNVSSQLVERKGVTEVSVAQVEAGVPLETPAAPEASA